MTLARQISVKRKQETTRMRKTIIEINTIIVDSTYYKK